VVAEASLRERTISESSEEFSDVADDELDEDGEDSDGLPDGAGVEEAPPPRKSTPVETLPAQPEISHPPRAASPDAASHVLFRLRRFVRFHGSVPIARHGKTSASVTTYD